MEKKITLVVVDFQYDFCLLGAPLYVPGSDRALWNISHLIENKKIGEVIFTADWHPANHCSFKRNGGEWNDHCVQFSEFGTRRRYSYNVQEAIVKSLKDSATYCTGTSNCYLAMKYDMPMIGTHPHEWFMFHGAMYGYKQANYMALEDWVEVYDGDLGIALSDTYTSAVFFKNLSRKQAKWLIGYYYGCGIKKEVDADGARKICDMCEAIKKSMSLTPTDGLGISNSDLDQIGAKSYYDVDRVLQTLTCKASPENDKLQDELTTELGPDVVGKITGRRFKSRFKRLVSPIIVPREMYD